MTDRLRAIPPSVHEAAEDWVLLLQHEPDAAQVRQHAAWLAASEDHRRAYASAAATWRDGLLMRDSAEGRARKLVKAPLLMRRSTHVAAMSLGVTVMVVVGAISVSRYWTPPGIIAQASAESFRTSIGEIRSIALRDGTKLTLDTATTIAVVTSPTAHRIDLLRGRLRVSTGPETGLPVTVGLHGAAVTARSGTFDADERGSTVSLLRGAVAVRDPADQGPTSIQSLRPGQQVTLGRPLAKAPIRAAAPQWTDGMFRADHTPLGDAVSEINRYNRVQIVLAEPENHALRVSGAFRVRAPEEFVRAVAAMFGMTIAHEPDRLILRRRDAGTPGHNR